jgi:hypothetical protein
MWRRFLILSFAVLVPSRANAGPLRVSALFEWEQGFQRQGYAGFLLLELPLERLARPALPPVWRPQRGSCFAEDAALPKPAETRPPKTAEIRSRPLPVGSVRRLLRAALAHSSDANADERLQSLSSRMRAAAALPELSLRAARSTSESLRLSPNGPLVRDYTQTGGAGLLFEARATWRFDRIVFADDELHVERLRIQRERVRERVIELLLKHLFAWQRARSRLLTGGETLSDDERALGEAELDSARAALDVLTDGAFSDELPRLEAASDAEVTSARAGTRPE